MITLDHTRYPSYQPKVTARASDYFDCNGQTTFLRVSHHLSSPLHRPRHLYLGSALIPYTRSARFSSWHSRRSGARQSAATLSERKRTNERTKPRAASQWTPTTIWTSSRRLRHAILTSPATSGSHPERPIPSLIRRLTIKPILVAIDPLERLATAVVVAHLVRKKRDTMTMIPTCKQLPRRPTLPLAPRRCAWTKSFTDDCWDDMRFCVTATTMICPLRHRSELPMNRTSTSSVMPTIVDARRRQISLKSTCRWRPVPRYLLVMDWAR